MKNLLGINLSMTERQKHRREGLCRGVGEQNINVHVECRVTALEVGFVDLIL